MEKLRTDSLALIRNNKIYWMYCNVSLACPLPFPVLPFLFLFFPFSFSPFVIIPHPHRAGLMRMVLFCVAVLGFQRTLPHLWGAVSEGKRGYEEDSVI